MATPKPEKNYECDHGGKHITEDSLRVCDVWHEYEEFETAARREGVDIPDWLHAYITNAEDKSWAMGFMVALGASGEILAKLIAILEKVDDDEVGMLLDTLKGKKAA